MKIKGFEPSNTKGEFFPVAPPSDDVTIYYHATSRLFSPIIEEQGFLPEFRFVSDEELAVLQKHAYRFVVSGTNYLLSLMGAKPITLSRTSTGVLRYIDPSRKGGIAKTLLDDVRLLLSEAELAPCDREVLEAIVRRFEPLEREDAIIYAVGLSAEEEALLDGSDPCHAKMVPHSALLCAMIVPCGTRFRLEPQDEGPPLVLREG